MACLNDLWKQEVECLGGMNDAEKSCRQDRAKIYEKWRKALKTKQSEKGEPLTKEECSEIEKGFTPEFKSAKETFAEKVKKIKNAYPDVKLDYREISLWQDR